MSTSAFVEGVEALIDRLVQTGMPWGVVTNKQARFTVPLTRGMPLFDRAATVVSGDSTPTPKPHPAPLLLAARQMSLEPSRCIYVGDDERDVQAGRAAGMGTVAALYGYLGAAGDARGWGADACVEHPLDLLKLIA